MLVVNVRPISRGLVSTVRRLVSQRRSWLVWIALAIVYAGLSGLAGLLTTDTTDLDLFFLPSARLALSGHALNIYTVHPQSLYPDAIGPLGLAPLVAIAAIALRLGWLDSLPHTHLLFTAACSLFSVLMAGRSVREIKRLSGGQLRASMRVASMSLLLFNPVLYFSAVQYGHLEQPLMLWFALCAVGLLVRGRVLWAGVLLGLAILTRSTGALYLLPVVTLLITRRRYRAARTLLAMTVLTVTLGLGPFILTDPGDVAFSLVGFRAALPIRGGSIWILLRNTALEPFVERGDLVLVLGFALGICLLICVVCRDLLTGDRDMYGLTMLVALCFPLLAKTALPYYFLEPYVFAVIWAVTVLTEASRRGVWLPLLVPALVAACAGVLSYGSRITSGSMRFSYVGFVIFILQVCVMFIVGAYMLPRPTRGINSGGTNAK